MGGREMVCESVHDRRDHVVDCPQFEADADSRQHHCHRDHDDCQAVVAPVDLVVACQGDTGKY